MATRFKNPKKKRGPGRPAAGPLNHPLARLRLDKGYTRAALAEKLGISADQISAIEYGRSRFPVAKLRKLAELFGLTINDRLILKLYPE